MKHRDAADLRLPTPHGKGAIVARTRPTASKDVSLVSIDRARREPMAGDLFTPAQARALSRSAPLTSEQFNAHRRLVDQHSLPLHVVLGNEVPVAVAAPGVSDGA